MTRIARHARPALLLLPLAALLAAAPPAAAPDDLVRRANEALRAGDVAEADTLYAAAEERTADPGLVAFNRAAVLFDRKEFAPAERHYDRVLEDAACPPERAARAWYNRGTCLLNRGGNIDVYRAAIACFENALDSPVADQEVMDRAPHNLELAKLRWNEERKKAARPNEQSPNDKPPPEEDRAPRPDPNKTDGGQEPNPTDDGSKSGSQKTAQTPQAVPQPKTDNKAAAGDQNVPANNPNLRAPRDDEVVEKLTPEAAREYLQESAKRRKRELHTLLETLYGPDRAGARDR